MGFYVVVHGGAGFHSHESEKEVLKFLRRASSDALSLLQRGVSSLEAVEKAITIMEDAEPLNAGYGSNLTESGAVECDAAIMDGAKNFGSVGALSGICNPITVARAVLDHSLTDSLLGRLPPMILVAGGAYDFAVAKKLPTTDPKALISSRARNDWLYWKERITEANDPNEYLKASLLHDTVGAVALDCNNGVAAGVSSGGILHKIPGRLGEASFFGAGCWADNTLHVACSVSGTGEAIIRLNLARKLCETLVSAENPEAALLEIFENELANSHTAASNHNISAGAILLIRENDGRGEPPSAVIGISLINFQPGFGASSTPQVWRSGLLHPKVRNLRVWFCVMILPSPHSAKVHVFSQCSRGVESEGHLRLHRGICSGRSRGLNLRVFLKSWSLRDWVPFGSLPRKARNPTKQIR